jgi:ABC-type transport system involved in multi-copper enzyme maturation permease subunit
MNAFMLLTWREWRRDRPIVLSIVAIVPTIALLIVAQNMRDIRGDFTGNALRMFLEMAVHFALMLGVVFVPVLAAHAVAGERADRSARFVAALPVTRLCRLTAKVATLLGLVLLLWVPFLVWLVFQPPTFSPGPSGYFGMAVTLTLLTTALAWLLAAWLDTVVVAAGAAIFVPLAVWLLLSTLRQIEWEDRKAFFELWIRPDYAPSLLTLLVAAACFAAGTAIYLQRTE